MQKLARLARSKERLAGYELRRLKRALTEQDEQLTQLNDYRKEYSDQLKRVVTEGVDVTALRNFHLFFRGLNDAIDQQGSTVENHNDHLRSGEARWRQEYRKANSLDNAFTKMQKDEQAAAEKIVDTRSEDLVTSRKITDRSR